MNGTAPACLFLLTVAASGESKSPADRLAMRCVRDLEADLRASLGIMTREGGALIGIAFDARVALRQARECRVLPTDRPARGEKAGTVRSADPENAPTPRTTEPLNDCQTAADGPYSSDAWTQLDS